MGTVQKTDNTVCDNIQTIFHAFISLFRRILATNIISKGAEFNVM